MNKHGRNGGPAINQKHKTGVSSIGIEALPAAILFDIFMKLQISSIMDCKLVCTAWYKLLHDPIFIENYERNSPFIYFVNTSSSTCRGLIYKHFSFIGVSEEGDCIDTPINPQLPDTDSDASSLSLVDSCNGFLCFEVTTRNSISAYIANPIMGECFALPTFCRCRYNVCHKFGFSQLTNSLKVIRYSYNRIHANGSFLKEKFAIFTVGVDAAWRTLENISPRWIRGSCVFVSGSFHWIAKDEGVLSIHAFDLGDEKVGKISHPPDIVLQQDRHYLASLGGHLCLLNGTVSRITLWKMKEYGVADSWTRDVIVRLSDPLSRDLRVVSLLKNGDILMLNEFVKPLVSYNCKTKKHTKFIDFNFLDPIIFTPSLKKLFGDGGTA